ncbi:MAG TPA: sialidase family protein, partial [Ktedonobacteraceae bacterium]|nr:sialidase family protein [Ktedonobacteraceae bacterium]
MKYVRSALIMVALALLLIGCDSAAPNSAQSTPNTTLVPVNGFGSAANHVHSLLALPQQVLIMATHYGLFRSKDNGATWQEVAGGPDQLMEGLMTYSLIISPLNSQRMYVLAQPSIEQHTGIPGLYTSADQGKTWKLSVTAASLTAIYPYTAAPGNDTPDEVYIYLSDRGALGLLRSLDDGVHFSSTGTLPFDLIFGILALPNMPGHLLVYGSDGMASSTDGGIHWQVISSISGGVEDVVTAGPHSPIYASGDAGVYVSLDEGKTFKLVYSQASFSSLAVTTQQAAVVYGKTATATYRSNDGGRTWSMLPHIN